jgi:uncharacterized membrane protein YesL
MTTLNAIWGVITILGLAVCGWLCIFRTNTLVTWARKNSKPPFSSISMKPQYPAYIRCVGAFILLWAIALIYAVLAVRSR